MLQQHKNLSASIGHGWRASGPKPLRIVEKIGLIC